ncbi:LAMI_0E04720g1_1 [Lachancea mirantina]|uniref:LAMI_0E04720g1_1 n=1 Tax=Lachancea mirantina TaxID=1230905 RepID=A0A1G4JKK0_9SACH|nr:LAMI_0E04720g1_1 [Lachancea mirantina]
MSFLIRQFQPLRSARIGITPYLTSPIRNFSISRPIMFQVGDSIKTGLPGIFENSPGNYVDIGKEVAKGKYVIVGLPAAFSPACTSSHVPGYAEHLKDLEAKGVKGVFIVPVNDPFVTKAWADSLNVPKGIRILADTRGAFAESGGALFDSEEVFGNKRSGRYAIIVDDGVVSKVFEEPDKTGLKVSSAENVLKAL